MSEISSPVESPIQDKKNKNENDDIELRNMNRSRSTASATISKIVPSLIKTFKSYDKRTQVELAFFSCATAVVFALALNFFLGESISTLVPFQSISQCSTSQQMYSFSEQHVEYSYPMALKFVDYTTGSSTPGIAHAHFAAEWKSCGGNSLNASSFGLSAGEQLRKFVPLEVKFVDALADQYNASIRSNDGCFEVTCGFNYTYKSYTVTDANLQSFQNNTLIEVIGFNINDVTTFDNGTVWLGNSQLMVSISQTQDSVYAQCVVGIAGTLDYVLSQSNSVSSSGTYLCTTESTVFQSLSSSLSLCLSFIGGCKLYFLLKAFYTKAPKNVSY